MQAWDRYDKLMRVLKRYGLDLRDDSVICRNYIRFGEGKPEKIGKIMNEMRFFFAHTDFK